MNKNSENEDGCLQFEVKDQLLTEEMTIGYAVQREMIVYLTDFLKLKHPYRSRDEYAMYIIGVMGEKFRRWYKGLCGKVTDADFAREYVGNPEQVIRAVTACSNFPNYLRGFALRFKKKLRRKMKLEKQADVPAIRKKVSGHAMAALDK